LSNRAIGLAKLVLVLSIVVCASAVQADEFRRLSAAQIQRLIMGKRITDDTHWEPDRGAGRKAAGQGLWAEPRRVPRS
jgi:hypothetical protein